MIVYPENWEQIGTPISKENVEKRIKDVVSNTCCSCLALSGGLDSSLLFSFMLEIYATVEVFTIGRRRDHPDIRYAKEIVRNFENERNVIRHRIYVPTEEEIRGEPVYGKDMKGDKATRLFYRFVGKYTDRIISGDGADEFNAGYYGHQGPEIERIYYEYIRRLQVEQLVPLNGNSGNVKVYLPYLDKALLYLLCQIPLIEKVNTKQRKIFMVEMAKGGIPESIMARRKIGFCDALEGRDDIQT